MENIKQCFTEFVNDCKLYIWPAGCLIQCMALYCLQRVVCFQFIYHIQIFFQRLNDKRDCVTLNNLLVTLKVILCSHLILQKMNKYKTDSYYINNMNEQLFKAYYIPSYISENGV